MNLVFNMNDLVAHWVAQRVKTFKPNPGQYVAIGVADGQRLIAGVVYHDYTGAGISMTFASDDPRWATQGTIASLLRYPFEQLQCRRITACAARSNKRSRKLIEGIGFKLEGVIREGFGKEDAILYGLLKREATKWIQGECHRKIIQSAASA